MKWTLAAALIAALLTPAAAHATPPKPRPLPACTPYQREHWRVTDRNTVIEGREILIHTSPDGARRCGEVKVSTARPQAPRKGR